jgi:hypothetical protein
VEGASKLFSKLDLALVGIGSLEPSSLLASSGNIFSPEERRQLRRAGAVGDICFQFIDKQGGLVDSPLLQLAWIAEKVHEWTDLPVDRDQLLTTVSLYWFTGSGASAAHTLYEQAHSSDWGTPPAVPQGFAVFGADETVRRLVPAPAGAHWSEFPRGQHFPAMEAPAQLAADLQAFYGPLQ